MQGISEDLGEMFVSIPTQRPGDDETCRLISFEIKRLTTSARRELSCS
jgi:hypothetical protein